ncbi:putative ribonuclease H-like domain-containing protein [Tanacetum coccineum]
MPYSHAVKGNWGTAVKTSAGYNWRNTRPNSNCNSGSNFIRTVNAKGPQGRPKPEKAWRYIDSGCSRHMTGNKDHLDDFEECKGGSVTFGGSKGYITGKGRIRVGTHNMYSFDMKTPAPTKDYACLISKATSNESKLWHRRKPNVKGVGYRWMFDIDYLTDSMNYIPVSLENQTNPHAGTSEVTNSAGTLQTPNANASEEEDEARKELIVVRTVAKHTASKVGPRKSFTNSKAEESFIELQNLKTQEKEAYPTGILVDTPEILAFRRELDELAQNHLREIPKNKANSTAQLIQVWILVDLPHRAKVIRTKWVYRNKRDKRGVAVRNKARLVAPGHRQEEGNNYGEVFAHVARIEAIRLFLAFSSFMRFIVYQMDVKSAFLYGTIDEEVYVSQPPSFVDPDHPKKVYKVVKALYGLHQAPRACDKKDIMLVQVYVDDILFGSTRKSWCDEFEALMKGRFQMSSMGELIFFFVNTTITPGDQDGVTPKTSHLNAVKRIFKYLKGKPNLGLWYPRESPFDLEAYSDSDYAGANLDRKSITGGC